MGTLRLDMLPTEMLLIIFNYCDLYDLLRLDQVCKRFHNIIRSNAVWKRHYKNFLVTNQESELFRQRCNLLLSSYSGYFISQNWIQGRYQGHILQRPQDVDFIQLQLTSDKLWWNNDNIILGFDRQETTHQKSNTVTFPEIKNDIAVIDKFIPWRDYIVTGHIDGSIMWQAESPVKNKYNGCYECIIKKRLVVHPNPWYYLGLDATSNVIFSASGSEYALIRVENCLDIDSINNDNIVRKEIREGKVHSLAIHPFGTILTATLLSDEEVYPNSDICHIDLEQTFSDFEKRINLENGMTDMLWEDPNTLLMCSPEGYIQKWDFRVNDVVSTWHYLGSEWIWCISSDHHNTMITGADHARAVLWDQRMPSFVQIYCMPAVFDNKFCTARNSIDSVRFDSTKLYCASNRFLYEFDFSKRGCPVRDYKSNPVKVLSQVINCDW